MNHLSLERWDYAATSSLIGVARTLLPVLGWVVAILLFIALLLSLRNRFGSNAISLNIPFNMGSWSFDTTPKDRIVAWKLYIQLMTRKAALPFDRDHDVISEIYDSFLAVFEATRELLAELPPREFGKEGGVTVLILRVLNDGLRPHLTRWQCEYRRWWDHALGAATNREKSPLEIQRQYPKYEALVTDLEQTNTELSKLADELLRIARRRGTKRSKRVRVVPSPPTADSAREVAPAFDFKIEPSGTLVVLQSQRATQFGKGPRPSLGSRLAFKFKSDTSEFVRALEAEGLSFEGKEFLDLG